MAAVQDELGNMRAVGRPGLGVPPSHAPTGVSMKVIVPRLGETGLTSPLEAKETRASEFGAKVGMGNGRK